MSRVVRAILFGMAMLVSGCATEAQLQQPKQRARTTMKIIRETCTTTMTPVCPEKKDCGQIKTCAEAYYRYAYCGDTSLDGGDGYPRDGIPCQTLCIPKRTT
jgi:hypothetical protein